MKPQSYFTTILSLLLLSCLFVSCEQATDYQFSAKELDFIIVNGLLTNEKKQHEIIISLPVKQPNEKAEPVTGAQVFIYSGDSLHTLTENPDNSGIYKTDEQFRAVINRAYTLLIITSKGRYYASTYMLPVSPFRELRYSFDESKQLYTIDSVTQSFDNNESALYEIQVDWTQVPGYDSTPDESKKATLYYYTLSTIDISELFAPEKEKIYFPPGTTIVESKFSVTPEHASFIRSMLLETEWRGGGFDVAHGNVETNISDGAFGYFAVSTVIRDTVVVE